jgi:hypothetical protein
VRALTVEASCRAARPVSAQHVEHTGDEGEAGTKGMRGGRS